MADTKKYLDLIGLQGYDEKIKAYIETKDTAIQNAAAADATSKANAAKTHAEQQAAAVQTNLDKTQDEVDALENLVGTIPSDATATTVIGYVQEKTANIASDATVNALAGRVTQAETDIDNIEKDYLKAADKTELAEAITAEADRAKGVEGGLNTRLAAVEADYLKAADKTELAEAIATAEESAVDRVLGYIADEEVNTDFDTLKEVAAWIESDTTRAAELTTRVTTAEGKVSTLESKVSTLEGEMDTAQADIVALQAAVGDGGSVDKMIDAAVAVETEAREEAIADVQADADKNAEDITALVGRMDTAEGEIDALQEASATHAKQTDLDAVAGRMTTAEGKITTLEGKAHTHDNKAVLDLITAELKASYDDAVAKAHTHSNMDALNTITAAKISAWDNSLADAKAYADGKFVVADNAITTSEIDALFA